MRNSGPEKLVELEVLSWAGRNGFDLSVVDTAAVWNPMANRYLRRQASESLPDLIGNYGSLSIWIELKAKGSRSAINAPKSRHQREFLMRKIRQGCFAVVTDGVPHLSLIWSKFKEAGLADRQALLISDLPQERITKLSARQYTSSKKPPADPAK